MSAWSEQKNRRSIYGRFAPTKAEILAEFFEFASLVEEIPSRFKRRADHPDPVPASQHSVMRLSAAAASCARADTPNRQPAPLEWTPML
jgi:hypothetical protein